MEDRPSRFTIRPDDYHVPYAGTAEDGLRFFLSDELFSDDGGWVGLFLWEADGAFDDVRISPAERDQQLLPGQAGSAASDRVEALLAELGEYRLEPITVEPFIQAVDGVEFGWRVVQADDGSYFVNIEPGDFICYYAPWDGYEYDT